MSRLQRAIDRTGCGQLRAAPPGIYGGIHWQFDNQAGLASGRALAQYVFFKLLTPVAAALLPVPPVP